MFGSIKNNYHKSAAAVTAQQILDRYEYMGSIGNPAEVAHVLVRDVWASTPHLFDGRFGQRPFKLIVAAAAFANALNDQKIPLLTRIRFGLCLSIIFQDLQTNATRYPLNGIDDELVAKCVDQMLIFSDYRKSIGLSE